MANVVVRMSDYRPKTAPVTARPPSSAAARNITHCVGLWVFIGCTWFAAGVVVAVAVTAVADIVFQTAPEGTNGRH